MKYTLMNAEHEVPDFETDDQSNSNIISILDEFDYAPLHFCRHTQNMGMLNCDLAVFLRCRTIKSARSDAKDIFAATGVNRTYYTFTSLVGIIAYRSLLVSSFWFGTEMEGCRQL